MNPITDKQRNVLRLINEYKTKNSYPPSINDIASELKVAQNAAQLHVAALDKKGFITKVKGRARSINLTVIGLMELSDEST